jgi:O-antigen/teichoic acid export membrane protein
MHPAPVIARNVVWLAGGELLVKGSVLVATALVGRLIGASGLGELTVAWGLMLIAVTIMAGGQVEVLVRTTATAPQAAGGHLARSLKVTTRLTAAVAVVLGLGVLLVERPGLRACLLTFIPYAVLRARMIVVASPHKGLDRMGVETRARALESAIALPLLAIVASWLPESWVAGVAFTTGAAAATGWLSCQRRRLPAEAASGRPFETVHRHWREGLTFLALALTFQLLLRSDTLLLALLGIPSHQIGQYGVASMWVWGVLAGPQLLAMAAYPTFSRMADHNGRSGRATRVALLLGLGSGAALASVLFLIRSPLVHWLYGDGFGEAIGFLATLAWALPGAGAAMCLGTVLAAWHRQRWTLAVYAAAVTVTMAATLYWVPKAGPIAAAYVAVGVQSLLAGVLAAATSRAGHRAPGAP